MNNKKRLIVKTNRELENKTIYQQLHRQCRHIDISRRKVPMAIHQAIFDFNGEVVWPDGTAFRKPVCIFTEFDLENRWYSWFLRADSSGRPKSYSQQYRRLRLLDLWQQLLTHERH